MGIAADVLVFGNRRPSLFRIRTENQIERQVRPFSIPEQHDCPFMASLIWVDDDRRSRPRAVVDVVENHLSDRIVFERFNSRVSIVEVILRPAMIGRLFRRFVTASLNSTTQRGTS